jgi:hypothetical protein
MPACSWSLPSVGEMLCTVCSSRSNCTGSAPYRRRRARSVASPLLNAPEICTLRPVIPSLIVGADCTTPSSSIATRWLTYGPATFCTKSSFLNVMSVTYDAVFVS